MFIKDCYRKHFNKIDKNIRNSVKNGEFSCIYEYMVSMICREFSINYIKKYLKENGFSCTRESIYIDFDMCKIKLKISWVKQ